MIDWGPNVTVSPPGPKSQAALKRLMATVGRGNYMGLYGLFLAAGRGCFVKDLDGNCYLDCLTGAATNNLGYGYSEVAEAYRKTCADIQHTSFSYSPTLHGLELAETLCSMTPGTFSKKAFLGLCGSKSNEDAVEIAWRATGRQRILFFEGTYLGATWLTKVACGFIDRPYLDYDHTAFHKLPFPRYQDDYKANLGLVEQQLAMGDVAAVMIETILCDGGNLMPPAGFYAELAQLARRHGSVVIVDEVQTGMGRTGRWWGSDWEGIEPDLLVVGKSLAAGFAPISALIGRAELVDVIEQGKQIGTFIGHPPSAAAALTAINCIQRDHLLENVALRGEELQAVLREMVRDFPDLCLDVRGRGLLLGLEISRSRHPQGAKLFAMRCLEKGLYLGYYGAFQEVIRIVPPFTIGTEQVAFVRQVIRETAQEMENGSLPPETTSKVERFAIGLPMPQPDNESYCFMKETHVELSC
ncbi:MAG: hypothetical protein C0614_02865 [Desulfuromonas sp.]|nr:MAG: hypothetical protein C0614_02865 [Desulfuromonas sp.]